MLILPPNGRLKLLGFIFTIILISNGTQGMNTTDDVDPNDLGYKHPLNPLTPLEIRLTVKAVLIFNNSSPWQFKYIGLHEPDKTLLYPYFLSQTIPPSMLIPRRADVILTDPDNRIPIEAVVNIRDLHVERWKEHPNDTVATVSGGDDSRVGEIALQNPDVQNRLKALGFNSTDNIKYVTWDAGYVADNPNYAQARKLLQLFFCEYKGPGTNYYAHPLDFVAYVELGPNVVRGIESLPIQQSFDTTNRSGDSPTTQDYNLFPGQRPVRRTLNPLKISQPDGPSFKISGYHVSWDNFTFRLGFNQLEGPYLYQVAYSDHGTIRPVAYRISITEAYLQYGDPRPPYHRKVSFDLTSWAFGASLITMPAYQLCRGDAYYYSVVNSDDTGETSVIEDSICLVEEDAGLLWAQYDSPSGNLAAVRAQRLAMNYMVSIGNDNYFISWRFYQDATIELAIKILGLYSVNLMAIDVKAPIYGNLVGRQLYTQNYQCWLAVRIDADVDGRNNSVEIEDIVPVSDKTGPTNPYGNGMMAKEKVLQKVGEAPSDIAPGRKWKITNNDRVNPLSGKPVAWKLLPLGNQNMPNLLTKDSPLRGLIPWAEHNMWVLPYNPEHILVGSKFRSCGVKKWTEENKTASLVDTDVVLWHVFNYVEDPNVEEWPVISGVGGSGTLGFRLRPQGFLGFNPAIELPLAGEMTGLDGRENEGYNCSGVTPKPPGGVGWSG